MIGLGFWYQKCVSKSLSAYFLGGKSIHRLALPAAAVVALKYAWYRSRPAPGRNVD